MFYYLHFTRPPPEQALLSHPLIITPNIANDLRTEHPIVTVDVYYAWVKCLNKPNPHSSGPVEKQVLGPMTRPQKLCTWSGSAYKEVQLYPPKEAQSGDFWQLLLCAYPINLVPAPTSSNNSESHASRPVFSVDLSLPSDKFGSETVFPILSSPVLFNIRKEQGIEKKQVQNERILKLPFLWGSENVSSIRLTEHLSYDLDKKVWDSGLGLSNWLIKTMTNSVDFPPPLQRVLELKSPRILELGTGTGLVSVVLATLLEHHPSKPNASLSATDLESAMKVLETNIENNRHLYPSISLRASVLDWEEDLPLYAQEGIDLIVMADVAYNTASFPALVSTLKKLHEASKQDPEVGRSGPIALLAYKERHPDERNLWTMAAEIGIRFVDVGHIPSAGGNPVEIYLGSFRDS